MRIKRHERAFGGTKASVANKSDLGTLIIVAVLVILLGVFLSYIAFNAGRNHGQGRYLRAP